VVLLFIEIPDFGIISRRFGLELKSARRSQVGSWIYEFDATNHRLNFRQRR
jgi:hypothetical protein